MTTAATTAVATTEKSPIANLSAYLDRFKPQLALALPKHMSADRMARLTLTAFSTTPALQECEPASIALAMLTAGQLGLEPGVNGACFIVPYTTKDRATDRWVKKAQLIPGWKGLVDLVSRSGRAAVWTGAVFAGDEFDYAFGDRPFISHKPGTETDPAALLYVYAVGRVNKGEWPIIDVWSMAKVWRHRDRVVSRLPDAQKAKHYSHRDPEMYARKLPLLQVLKYVPTSTELANAIAASEASDRGLGVTIDGDFVTVESRDEDEASGAPMPPPASSTVHRKSAAAPATPPAQDAKTQPDARAPGSKGGPEEFVTGANLKWLRTKLSSLELSDETVAAMVARAGGQSIDKLTPDAFDAMRLEIIQAT